MTTLFGKRQDASSIAGGGRVGTELGKFLAKNPSGGSNSRSASEWAADVLSRTTGVGIERGGFRKILRKRHRLTKAVESYQRHSAAAERFTTEDRIQARKLREQTSHSNGRSDLATRSNPAVSLISGPFLLLVEVTVLVAEVTFYYFMFSGDLRDDAGFLERAMVIVLAMFIPVVGIAFARWFGASVTAVRGYHTKLGHPNPSKVVQGNAVFLYLALLTSTVFLAVICWGTFLLVAYRYTGEVIPGLSAHPPAHVMATMFVGAILLDAGVRGFAVPIAARSDAHLRRAIRSDRRREKRLANARSKALTTWVNAWASLETVLNVLLDDIEKAISAADIHILAARSQQPSGPGDETVDRLQAAKGTVSADGITIAPRLNLPHVNLQLRLLDAAFAQLNDQCPPAYTADGFATESLRKRLDGAHTHLDEPHVRDAA